MPDVASEQWIELAAASLPVNKDEEIQLKNGEWRALKTRLAHDGTAMVVVSHITATKQAEIALQESANQLSALADTDGLTNLTNRRAFDRVFATQTEHCISKGMPLSVLIIDVDRFKAYNDTYGHLAGDDCLRAVGRCLDRSVKRAADLVACYGGEEFVVLLPNTDEKGAAIVADEFARFLAYEYIPHAGSEFGRMTASIGISTATGKGLHFGSARILSEADGALYEAKENGRNQSVARTLSGGVTASLQ
ncbi:diguanylate cyclase [Rhizobium sp. PDO1-076]|nr:diguanylate cyclase [Rhizobium sp. PDO1-076]